MEIELQRTTDLKAILTESVQEFAKRIEKVEKYVGELRSQVTVKADAMNQSEIEELKWIVESQRTDIEASNGKIVSLEQKLNNILAESIQDLERRIAGNEKHVAEERSEMIPKADAMNGSEIEELKWTVESQKTDIEDLNRYISSLKQNLKDAFGESVQGLDRRIAENEEYAAELQSEMTPKANAINQDGTEELKCTVEGERTDIEDLNREIVSLKQKLESSLAELVQGLERRIASFQIEALRRVPHSQKISDEMNQSDIEELKWTVESQRTDIEGLNDEFLSFKQKLESTLAESVQDHERRILVMRNTSERFDLKWRQKTMRWMKVKLKSWSGLWRTGIECLNREIAGIKQKLKDTLAESVQGLEKRISGNKEHVAELRSEMTL